ncbi:hypothetical protein SCOR_29640 [Sulfidibacter corallicola]
MILGRYKGICRAKHGTDDDRDHRAHLLAQAGKKSSHPNRVSH